MRQKRNHKLSRRKPKRMGAAGEWSENAEGRHGTSWNVSWGILQQRSAAGPARDQDGFPKSKEIKAYPWANEKASVELRWDERAERVPESCLRVERWVGFEAWMEGRLWREAWVCGPALWAWGSSARPAERGVQSAGLPEPPDSPPQGPAVRSCAQRGAGWGSRSSPCPRLRFPDCQEKRPILGILTD